METIWETLTQSTYLRALGCRIMPDTAPQTLALANISGLPDGTAVTASRATFEVSIPELESRLHFATYGDPAFEAILALFDTFQLPACIRRLEVDLPDIPVKVVGYAVAQRDADDQPACCLVTSVHDLATLRLREAGQLTDADVEPVHRALAAMAQKEYHTTLMVPRIEAVNEDAGRSQERLDYLIIRGIVLSRQRTGGAESLFWREITALEEIFQEKDLVIQVRRIPSMQARALSGLLFDVTIPTIGEESSVGASHPLLMAALEAAQRLANGMKVKRAELSTDDFLARLSRVIDQVG